MPEFDALELELPQDIPEGMAIVTITYNRQQGHMADPVPYDSDKEELLRIMTEAIQTGGIHGVAEDPDVDLTDYQVERVPAVDAIPVDRLVMYPKTPFGGE